MDLPRNRKKSIAKHNQATSSYSGDPTLPQESEAIHLHSNESGNPSRKKKKSIGKQDQDTVNQQEGTNELEQRLYDAASNGNSSNLNQILENCKYRISNEDLENSVLKVYTELKLNNIALVDEVELSLYEFFAKRCFFPKNSMSSYKIPEIKKHLKMLANVVDMVSLFADEQEIFILSLKYIAKEIYVLKQLLRSTYEKLPWEEIEFYLVCYIISATQPHELNVFYRAILKKSDLIRYLKMFSLSLKKLQLEETSKLSKLPELNRNDIVRKIIKNNPDLKAMYKDYDCIRDVHSLYKISKYAKFVHSTHPQEKGGNQVIIRALYVISLHLKNTLVSPKLSQITADFILLSISENSRTPILGLLNACSYREAFRYRTELLENYSNDSYLQKIRNDVEHIGEIADDLLFRHFIRLFRQQYPQIVENKTVEEKITPLFLYVHKELQRLSEQNLTRHADKLIDNLKYLSSQLSENDTLRMQMENMIEAIILSKKQQFEFEPIFLFIIKPEARGIFLQYLKPKLSTNDVEKLLSFVFTILEDNAKKNPYRYEIEQLCSETINLLRFEVDNDTLNEKFKETPTTHQELSIDRNRKEHSINYQNHLSQTLRTLKNILDKSHYKKFKTDNKSFEILKSLVLDVIHNFNIVSDEEETESDPNLSSIWIDYLESDYELNDLNFNSIVAVFHIANKFIQEDPKHLILRSNETKTSREKSSFLDYFKIILKKQKQLSELAKGNVAAFQLYLDEGADIRARDAEKSTYLHIAVNMSDISLVENLCNLGLSLSCKNIGFLTPLHIAAKIGNNEIVAYIANKTRSVLHDIDDFGRTALHIAVLNEHKQTVQILIDSGSDTSAEDHLGLTALLYAVMNGNEEIWKLFLLHDIKLDKVVSERNKMQTLFQNAIEQNLLEIVHLLLSNNIVTLDLETEAAAMSYAVSNGRREILETLLQHGADPVKAIDGKTALHIAVLNEHYQIIPVLLDAGSDPFVKDDLGQSSLRYALSKGKKEIITLLLPHSIDLSDSQRMELQYVFLMAIEQNYVEIVGFLLSGSFVSLRTQTDAVYFAVSNGQLKMLEILLQHGADPDNFSDGCAPILIAAQKNLDLIVEKLMEWKSDVNVSDPKDGMTALHHAAKNGYNSIIDCLLGHPAININSLDAEKQTPLHLAVENRHLSTVEILLGRTGIEVNALNSKRYTPLLIAIEKGDLNIAKLLIEKWALLNDKDYPVSPLSLAKVNRDEKIVQLLVNNGATSSKSSTSTFVRNDTSKTSQKNSVPLPYKHPSIILTKKNLENPTVIIRGVEPEYSKCNNDEIVAKIIEQNQLKRSLKYKFDIIKKTLKNASCSIIIVLDKTLYKEILDKKNLNIGWESCPVSDYSYICRCYRCAGFGHIHIECKDEEICGRCSKKHNMEECKSTDLKCINCMRKNESLGLHLDIRHSAFDQFCPYYRKLLEDKYKKQMKYSKLNH